MKKDKVTKTKREEGEKESLEGRKSISTDIGGDQFCWLQFQRLTNAAPQFSGNNYL